MLLALWPKSLKVLAQCLQPIR